MATKKIQLRGISRSPSDRMTEDGGVAESLNVQLMDGETAPMVCPEEVSSRFGMPEGLSASRLFVHKTSNYENLIAYVNKGAQIGWVNKGVFLKIVALDWIKGESLTDIVSIGNTIVVSSTSNMYYILFKDGNYQLLGNKVPFPHIRFWADNWGSQDFAFTAAENEDAWFERFPGEDEWNESYESGGRPAVDDHGTTGTYGKIVSLLESLWAEIDKRMQNNILRNGVSGKVFVRYALELYDGTLISSVPLLVAAGSPYPYSATITVLGDTSSTRPNPLYNEARAEFDVFSIKAKLLSDLSELDQWKDVVRSINIYMSTPSAKTYDRRQSRIYDIQEGPSDKSDYKTKETAKLFLGSKSEELQPINKLLELSSQTYLIAKCELWGPSNMADRDTTILDLKAGNSLKLWRFAEEYLQEQELLNHDDMKHYALIPGGLGTYNNSLAVISPKSILAYDYKDLNAYELEGLAQEFEAEADVRYNVYFHLRTANGEKIVHAGPFVYKQENVEQGSAYSATYGRVPVGGSAVKSIWEKIYAFQIFPDARAYRMDVIIEHAPRDGEESELYSGTFMMERHPYLDCAYYYGGEGVTLASKCAVAERVPYTRVDNVDEVENKLLVSSINNPFAFPINSTFSFQSKVIGIAVATAALSQGQFGQFPLYVFTEDGIWVMETAADGSFVSSKPLSRDVCINPDSIISIDNAVIFVTDKGVMYLNGSQITNISPNMNGRHYQIENAARTIVENQDFFCDLLPILSDNTHFLAFVKKASVAYDYAGKRLIFIKKDEEYQYIYKLDTQTWHKSATGMQLVAPINSYPECLVMGEGDGEERKVLDVVSFAGSHLNEYQLAEDIMRDFGDIYDLTMEQIIRALTSIENLDVTKWSDAHLGQLRLYFYEVRVDYEIVTEKIKPTKVYDLSTVLDAESKVPTRGIIVTRPFDLGEPDVFKTITDVRIRGQFARGAVKFILLGSNDGINFATLSTLRGRAWKLFRMIILADLAPTERISWIDVQYESKFTNKLR